MKVFSGPAHSGKSQRVIARVAEAIKEKRGDVLLIVPSMTATVVWDRLQRVLKTERIEARYQPVRTFPDLYLRLITGTAYERNERNRMEQDRWPMTPLERDRLLRSIINTLADAGKLEYFAETARMPGLVAAVAGFIDELWRSGADPETFATIAESRGAKDRDLARIFKAYAAELETALATDREGAGFAALRALEASRRDNHSLRLALVAADGFDFYTPVQVQLLARLAERGVETLATLTYEAGRATHLWQRPTVARLQNVGAEFDYLTAGPTSTIARAAARLMRDEATHPADANDAGESAARAIADHAIQIISAPDRAAEARAVARTLKRLVIEQGFALDDIAVVCNSMALYANHLERVFSECGIPLALDTKLGLVENPMFLAFVRLLELSAQNYLRRACMECWRSPYFDLSVFGLDETAVALLDIISLEENVTGSRAQWAKAISSFCDDPAKKNARAEYDRVKDETDDQRKARYETLKDNLHRFFEAITLSTASTASGFASWVLELATTLKIEERLNMGATAVRDQNAFKEFASIVNALRTDRFLNRDADEAANTSQRMQWADFLSELARAVAGVTYNRELPSGPAVSAQEVHHLRPRRYRAVFVLGLIEGEFPAKVAERAPYTLVERDELRRAGVDLTETTTDAGADLTQFAKAMSRASERLYLTHARTDLAGGELLPSYLLEETRAIVAVSETRIAQSFSRAALATGEDAASLDELALLAAQSLGDGLAVDAVPSADHVAAHAVLELQLPSWQATTRGARLERHRLARRGDGFIRDADLLSDLKHRFGPEHLWSAHQMNDYGSCPFRFFARHALKLAPVEEPLDGFGPRRLGLAYHDILEQLYTRLLDPQQPVATANLERVLALAEQVCEEVLENLLERGTVRRTRLWEFEKREIKRRIARLLDKEAEWNDQQPATPIHFERKFGIDGATPLVIETDEDDVKICGIVDRIDQRDDGWVVIDYKTGRAPIAYSEAVAGRNLQLPIYAMAASRVIGERKPIAAAYYLHIYSRKKGSELPHKSDAQVTVDSLIAHAEAHIRDYVARVRRGEFSVRPSNATCCVNCNYDVMCRIQSLGAIAEEGE